MLSWLQIPILLLFVFLLAKPIGLHIARVLGGENTLLDPILNPLERITYKFFSINQQEQQWTEYLSSLLLFGLGSCLCTALLLSLQEYLPLNPEHLPAPSWDTILNLSIGYMTNTDWQALSPEATLSHGSQMIALSVQNFLSPAMALCVGATIVRALTRSSMQTIGNFWVDLIRICYYLLLPLALIFAVLFMGQGVPQNFSHSISVHTVEGALQTIPEGPVASQEAIKLLGTNGGGFFNANSAHPYENPTSLSNLLQMIAILLIPAAQIYYFGHQIRYKKHSRSIFATLTLLFLVSACICIYSEMTPTPLARQLNLVGGNMEGKEQRFGVATSALYCSVTTDASCGAVCGSLDSLTPIGSIIPMTNMLFSEAIFGGCGSGLYIMLVYVLVTIFFAGLIIGRTPEYLGKKIEAREIKWAMIALLSFGLTIMGFTAWAANSSWGTSVLSHKGAHGFSEIFYAYISSVANNGSALMGLKANTPIYNITLAIAMLIGRFGIMIPVLALSGALVQKKRVPHTPNDLAVHGVVFTLFLLVILLLFGALAFLPALMLGPVLEQFSMLHGVTL